MNNEEKLNRAISANYFGYLRYLMRNVSIWRTSTGQTPYTYKLFVNNSFVYLHYVGPDSVEYATKVFIDYLEGMLSTKEELFKERELAQTMQSQLEVGKLIFCGNEIHESGYTPLYVEIVKICPYGVCVKTKDNCPTRLFNDKPDGILEFCYLKIEKNSVLYKPTNRHDKPIWIGDQFETSIHIRVWYEFHNTILELTDEGVVYRTDDGTKYTESYLQFYNMLRKRTFDWYDSKRVFW
jgi:hypothetical protein